MSSSYRQVPIKQEGGLSWLSSPSEDPALQVRDDQHLKHLTANQITVQEERFFCLYLKHRVAISL